MVIPNLNAWMSLIFGILILVFPNILNYLVAIYLILTGLSVLFL